MTIWRLLITPPARGAWNMALDESILEHIGRGESIPTLRLYAWTPSERNAVAKSAKITAGNHRGAPARGAGTWLSRFTDVAGVRRADTVKELYRRNHSPTGRRNTVIP